MKFFVDTADLDEIRELNETGLLDGVTTNPSLMAKTGKKIVDVIGSICEIVPGPVSAEVAATDYETMLKEGEITQEEYDALQNVGGFVETIGIVLLAVCNGICGLIVTIPLMISNNGFEKPKSHSLAESFFENQ